MSEILVVLSVVGLFLLRVGIPVVLLVGLGILIDRWQTKREAEARKMMKPELHIVQKEAADVHEERKAA
ncbi:MAG: hypothetical protein F9K27_15475 [Anaerolineae bacterium]|nr:MAG: hypothetical protein F9K27_15475 [Anaerolineae bacterium]